MVHTGVVGQYFPELDPNSKGPPRPVDPAIQARKIVSKIMDFLCFLLKVSQEKKRLC